MALNKKLNQKIEKAFFQLQQLKSKKKPTTSREKVRIDQIEKHLRSAASGGSKTRDAEGEFRLALELLNLAQVAAQQNRRRAQARQNGEQLEEEPNVLEEAADQLMDAAVDEAKTQGKRYIGNRAKQAAAGVGRKAALAVVRFFGTRAGLVVLAIIAVIVIILIAVTALSGGGSNKLSALSGGSIVAPMDYNKEEHRQLVDRVAALAQSQNGGPAVLEVAGTARLEDLTVWIDSEGKKKHAMDYRVMRTIAYLADQGWEKIVIGKLSSDGPDITRRKAQDKQNAGRDYDAYSAFSGGQAMGIVALGLTSPELTTCLGLNQPVPVQIAWQETMLENKVRVLHEQFEADASQLYLALGIVSLDVDMKAQFQQFKVSKENDEILQTPGALPPAGKEALDNLITNLKRFKEIGSGDINKASIRYADQALGMLTQVDREDVKKTSNQYAIGLRAVFRLLQVANVNGWQGDENDNCRLWKAYEARTNIRKLVLHLLQMPVKLAAEGQNYNGTMVAKQVIVYSPEDDLDNGLPDRDVFPSGAVTVSDGGIAFDDTGKDGKVDAKDNHFMALPFDNGILSKASTIFGVKETNGVKEQSSEELKIKDRGDDLNKLHEGLDAEYASEGRVSYKNFIQIAF